ncbi:MAG: DUF5063 domain-containing protein [Bacteroidales bacterium]|nr:DUF5063 domain-containing protein [Bacteroidales bacterium]MBD5221340.1 DUF5063 domain-containing protein [Bacteroidales bacterium]
MNDFIDNSEDFNEDFAAQPADTTHLMHIVALAGEYCAVLADAPSMEKENFVAAMLRLLPSLYLEFGSTEPQGNDPSFFLTQYLEEDDYMSVSRGIAALLGEDDSYLETIEEDMKYSDTPIGASVSEGLTDIYQDLFNFITEVRESEGLQLAEAYDACHENFVMYWSATLCSVLRPLNNIRYGK